MKGFLKIFRFISEWWCYRARLHGCNTTKALSLSIPWALLPFYLPKSSQQRCRVGVSSLCQLWEPESKIFNSLEITVCCCTPQLLPTHPICSKVCSPFHTAQRSCDKSYILWKHLSCQADQSCKAQRSKSACGTPVGGWGRTFQVGMRSFSWCIESRPPGNHLGPWVYKRLFPSSKWGCWSAGWRVSVEERVVGGEEELLRAWIKVSGCLLCFFFLNSSFALGSGLSVGCWGAGKDLYFGKPSKKTKLLEYAVAICSFRVLIWVQALAVQAAFSRAAPAGAREVHCWPGFAVNTQEALKDVKCNFGSTRIWQCTLCPGTISLLICACPRDRGGWAG